MKKIVVFINVLIIAFACTNPEKAAEKNSYDNVIAVHDKVMSKMGEIHHLKKELDKVIKGLEKESQQQKIITQLQVDLESVNESMMDWMRGFKKPDESMSHQQKMDYLQDQQLKIDAVKRKMEESIRKAGESVK